MMLELYKAAGIAAEARQHCVHINAFHTAAAAQVVQIATAVETTSGTLCLLEDVAGTSNELVVLEDLQRRYHGAHECLQSRSQ